MKIKRTLPHATISEHDGVRFLHLDSIWVQGAIRIARPRVIELEYVQRMMAWLLWRPEADSDEGLRRELPQAHAVQLGLGAGTITRFCREVLRMRATAVELNPDVVAACRMWFRLPSDDALLRVVDADAGEWVHKAANQHCADVLCVDLYDQDAAAPVLDSAEFYAGCRGVLQPGGVMSLNLFGRDSSFERSAGHVADAFGGDQVWRLRPTREGNTVLIAGRELEVPSREGLLARAANIERRYGALGLAARKWLRMVQPL